YRRRARRLSGRRGPAMSPYEPLLKSVEKTAATEEASLFGGGTDAWETVVGTVLLLDELGFVLFRAAPNRNYGGSQYHRNKKRGMDRTRSTGVPLPGAVVE